MEHRQGSGPAPPARVPPVRTSGRRSRVMPSLSGKRALAAVPTAHHQHKGAAPSAMWRSTNGRHAAISAAFGFLLPGGRQLDDVGDLDRRPVEPDRPPACGRATARCGRQNGRPRRSSSAPGASPMIMTAPRGCRRETHCIGRGALQTGTRRTRQTSAPSASIVSAPAASSRANCAASAKDSASAAPGGRDDGGCGAAWHGAAFAGAAPGSRRQAMRRTGGRRSEPVGRDPRRAPRRRPSRFAIRGSARRAWLPGGAGRGRMDQTADM